MEAKRSPSSRLHRDCILMKDQSHGVTTLLDQNSVLGGIERVRVSVHFKHSLLIVLSDTPTKLDYSLSEKPGVLRLWGSPYTLSIPTCPTLFLRKQTARSGAWSTRLSFQPTSSNTESGTVLWWNYFTYSSIGIRLSPSDSTQRIIRFRPAAGKEVTIPLNNEVSDVEFIIRCSNEKYEFGFVGFSEDRDMDEVTNTIWLGEIPTEDMTVDPPIGAAFTGMMLGIYAFGELEGCLVPADFKQAKFE